MSNIFFESTILAKLEWKENTQILLYIKPVLEKKKSLICFFIYSDQYKIPKFIRKNDTSLRLGKTKIL